MFETNNMYLLLDVFTKTVNDKCTKDIELEGNKNERNLKDTKDIETSQY